MIRKIVVLVVLVIGLLVGTYFYVYKGHKDIGATTADFKTNVNDLQKEFTTDGGKATVKYQDKVIEMSGTITEVVVESKSIVLDKKVYAIFNTAVPSEIKNQNRVTIKGRFLGYDELLEEFKIDQVSLVK